MSHDLAFERSETGSGDPDGSAGGAGGRASRGIDRSVIPHPTGTTGVAVLADLACWVVFAGAAARRSARGSPAGRPCARGPRAGDPCGGGARGPRVDHDAVRLRERARAGSNVRLQFELRGQAGLAFDEIAARRDIDPGRFSQAHGPAAPASVLLYLGVVAWRLESSFPVT